MARLFILVCLIVSLRVDAASDIQTLAGVTLAEDTAVHADEFTVSVDGESRLLRLYFVDAVESATDDAATARRLKEQRVYFGVTDSAPLLSIGAEADAAVAAWLAKPFTVYTAGARVPGKDEDQPTYAFVVTADGDDLAEKLVSAGFARITGSGRADWNGRSRDDTRTHLAQLELAAARARTGAWALAPADAIAALSNHSATPAPSATAININTASAEQLASLPGVGPVLAARIIEARPFSSVDDLRRVKGIGAATLEKLRPLTVSENQ